MELYKDVSLIKTFTTTQPTQRRRKDLLKKPYFWSQRCLRLVSNGSRDDLFLRRPKDVFQGTSLGPFPGDVLKTSFRRRRQDLFQETFLRRLRLHQDFFW